MTKNVFSIFLITAFSVSLFLFVSCATTFPAHEIHPDFECADSEREPIVISGTLKSKRNLCKDTNCIEGNIGKSQWFSDVSSIKFYALSDYERGFVS